MSLTKEDLQFIREVVREEITPLREENREEHRELRQLINRGIESYTKLNERVTRIEDHLHLT